MAPIISPPHHPADQPEPVTAEYLAAQLRWLDFYEGYWDDDVHARLIALEEALVSRKARRALRRQIREADRTFAWAGPGFRARRVEAVFNEHSVAMNAREGRAAA